MGVVVSQYMEALSRDLLAAHHSLERCCMPMEETEGAVLPAVGAALVAVEAPHRPQPAEMAGAEVRVFRRLL